MTANIESPNLDNGLKRFAVFAIGSTLIVLGIILVLGRPLIPRWFVIGILVAVGILWLSTRATSDIIGDDADKKTRPRSSSSGIGRGGITNYTTDTFEAPTDSATVSITDIGFEPDLLLFTATNNVSTTEPSLDRTDGWTYGKAVCDRDGTITQNVVSVADDARRSDAAVCAASSGQVVDLLLHDDEQAGGLAGSVTRTTADGFEMDFDASAVPATRAGESYVVLFEAFELVDRADVDVGCLTTPAEQTVQTVDLGTDADYVALTAVDPLGEMDAAQTTGGRLGISHGAAASEASVEQHVIYGGVESSPAGYNADAAFDDRAIHLVHGEGEDVDGRTSARVTRLGEQLELTYDEVHAPADSTDPSQEATGTTRTKGGEDAPGSDVLGAPPRLVTFVAMNTGEGPAPAVDHFEMPAADEGPKRVDTGFEPELVEFTVGISGAVGTERTAAKNPLSFGWSHGVALLDGTGGVDHHVLHSSVAGEEISGNTVLGRQSSGVRTSSPTETSDPITSPNADTAAASPSGEWGGACAIALLLGDDGRVLGRETVRVTDVDETGFDVAVDGFDATDESSGERPVVFYTAWPWAGL